MLDWTRASITIPTAGVHQVHGLLEGINAKRQEELRQQVSLTTDSYLSVIHAYTVWLITVLYPHCSLCSLSVRWETLVCGVLIHPIINKCGIASSNIAK